MDCGRSELGQGLAKPRRCALIGLELSADHSVGAQLAGRLALAFALDARLDLLPDRLDPPYPGASRDIGTGVSPMDPRRPYSALIDGNSNQQFDEEFFSLPHYPWSERPATLEVEHDEAATAIHLAHGDVAHAAGLLKVPIIRLNRLIRRSVRLQRVLEESLGVALVQAASIPLRTLFDPHADQRALEWASTKVLQSRLGFGHPLSPAPVNSAPSASLTLASGQGRTVTFRWRTDGDDPAADVS